MGYHQGLSLVPEEHLPIPTSIESHQDGIPTIFGPQKGPHQLARFVDSHRGTSRGTSWRCRSLMGVARAVSRGPWVDGVPRCTMVLLQTLQTPSDCTRDLTDRSQQDHALRTPKKALFSPWVSSKNSMRPNKSEGL